MKIEKLLQMFGGRCIIVENGEPRYVVMSVEEYFALRGDGPKGENPGPRARNSGDPVDIDTADDADILTNGKDIRRRRSDSAERWRGRPEGGGETTDDADILTNGKDIRRRRSDSAERWRGRPEGGSGTTDDAEMTDTAALETINREIEALNKNQEDAPARSGGADDGAPATEDAAALPSTPLRDGTEEQPKSDYRIEDIPF